MKTQTLMAIVILLGGCVTLAATNPTKFEFRKFLEAELLRTLDRMDATPPADARQIRQFLRSQGPKLIQVVVEENTARHNYGLFSLFETRLLGTRLSILGIGQKFLPLTDREGLSQLLAQARLPSPGVR